MYESSPADYLTDVQIVAEDYLTEMEAMCDDQITDIDEAVCIGKSSLQRLSKFHIYPNIGTVSLFMFLN